MTDYRIITQRLRLEYLIGYIKSVKFDYMSSFPNNRSEFFVSDDL